MPATSLDRKLEDFYDEFHMSRLFTSVWIGWRRYSGTEVFKAFKCVLEEQLGLGNINEEVYNGIVTEINRMVAQTTSRLYWRNRLNEGRGIIADSRKKLEENTTISEYLRYAQSEQYLKKANSKPSHAIVTSKGL